MNIQPQTNMEAQRTPDGQQVDINDPVKLNTIYVQFRDSILSGKLPSSQHQACQLAAMQIQLQCGNFDANLYQKELFNLQDFVPLEYRKDKYVEDQRKKIVLGHSKLLGLTDNDCKFKYVQSCKSLKTFGGTYFLAKEYWYSKFNLLLGITDDRCSFSNSLVLLNTKTKDFLKLWPLSQLLGWSCTKNGNITFNFGKQSLALICTDNYNVHHLLLQQVGVIHKQIVGSQVSSHLAASAQIFNLTAPANINQIDLKIVGDTLSSTLSGNMNQIVFSLQRLASFSARDLCQKMLETASTLGVATTRLISFIGEYKVGDFDTVLHEEAVQAGQEISQLAKKLLFDLGIAEVSQVVQVEIVWASEAVQRAAVQLYYQGYRPFVFQIDTLINDPQIHFIGPQLEPLIKYFWATILVLQVSTSLSAPAMQTLMCQDQVRLSAVHCKAALDALRRFFEPLWTRLNHNARATIEIADATQRILEALDILTEKTKNWKQLGKAQNEVDPQFHLLLKSAIIAVKPMCSAQWNRESARNLSQATASLATFLKKQSLEEQDPVQQKHLTIAAHLLTVTTANMKAAAEAVSNYQDYENAALMGAVGDVEKAIVYASDNKPRPRVLAILTEYLPEAGMEQVFRKKKNSGVESPPENSSIVQPVLRISSSSHPVKENVSFDSVQDKYLVKVSEIKSGKPGLVVDGRFPLQDSPLFDGKPMVQNTEDRNNSSSSALNSQVTELFGALAEYIPADAAEQVFQKQNSVVETPPVRPARQNSGVESGQMSFSPTNPVKVSFSVDSVEDKDQVQVSEIKYAKAGSVVNGRFLLQDSPLFGGMAVVRKAEDRNNSCLVALKVHSQVTDFKNEIKMLRLLKHEKIIEIRDFFAGDSGLNVIVLEWAPTNLARVMKRGPIKETMVRHITEEIGTALLWIHSKSVVHADLKPSNICKDPESEGSWKLIDFDTSYTIGSTVNATGTPLYMAPEIAVAMLRSQRVVGNVASDIWSLGIIVFEMITGVHPIDRSITDESKILKILADPLFTIDLPLVPNEQARYVCQKLLNHNPAGRPSMQRLMKSAFLVGGNDTKQSKEQSLDIHEKLEQVLHKVDEVHAMTKQILENISVLQKTVVNLSDSQVPRLFVIVPCTSEGFWKKVANIGSQKFHLHLICECSENPHMTDHMYEIIDPLPFMRKAGPMLAIASQLMVAVMNGVLPGLGQAIHLAMPSSVTNMLKGMSVRPSEFFENITGILDQFHNKKSVEMSKAEVEAISGPALRELEAFLSQHDPSKVYGNLHRCTLRTGEVRWLCKEHQLQLSKK